MKVNTSEQGRFIRALGALTFGAQVVIFPFQLWYAIVFIIIALYFAFTAISGFSPILVLWDYKPAGSMENKTKE